MTKQYLIGSIIGALLLAGVGYALFNNNNQSTELSEESNTNETVFTVATSFYPLQFALERIVGDSGVVKNIGAGRDPHNFKPSTQDILTLQQADLVVLQGAGFEAWGDDVRARLTADDIPVVVATANIKLHEGDYHHDDDEHADEHSDEDHEEEHEADHEEAGHEEEHEEKEHDHGQLDPHTWLDPVLYSEMVSYITSEISRLEPDLASLYQQNAAELKAELADLDADYKNRLSNCALDEVITSHAAFGYLAKRYDFSIHSIAGLSTQDSPSITTLAKLRAEAEDGIGAILLEENSITAYGETLARETGLVTLAINPISYIIPNGEDYLSLMQSNLNTFATALQCYE